MEQLATLDANTSSAKFNVMRAIGLHIMKPEWASAGHQKGRIFSTSFRTTTIKCFGTDEEMTFPVQTCTTVGDVRHALADKLLVNKDDLKFIRKQGCSWRQMWDGEEIGMKVVVKGIQSFKQVKHTWPHPVGIIGAGYMGIKSAMWSIKLKDFNFVVFDRNTRVGGYCWITAANKHSKLQTEFAAFHVWWGPPFGEDTRCGGMPSNSNWDIWPKKAEVLQHMQHAAEDYGILPHCRFGVNVAAMEVIGHKNDEKRAYNVIVNPLQNGEPYEMKLSAILSFPGCMCYNRIIEYPGEDLFGGQIGYAMNDDIPYDHLAGSRTAILGNGAFAIENVRTCCEYGVEKVFVVTRRKNLPCPRMPCWFVHQASIPLPARQLLNFMAPMYALAGLEDPWSFHSIYGKKDGKGTVTISQSSRFGIADVTFLAHAFGKLEYVEDTLKRLTKHTLHLSGGRKIEEVTNLLKALGLVGDYEVDRFHHMKKMIGIWPEGDFRRPIGMDAPGMHAANFETMSTGVPGWHQVYEHRYFLHYPKEMYRLIGYGLLDMLPQRKADDRPAYIFDVKYAMSAGVTLGSMCPKLHEGKGDLNTYKHAVMWSQCPLKEYLQQVVAEWDNYQKTWREQGWDVDYIPYPYTEETVKQWYKDHSQAVGSLVLDDSTIQAHPSSSTAKPNPWPGIDHFEDDPAYNEAAFQWWTEVMPCTKHYMSQKKRSRSSPPQYGH